VTESNVYLGYEVAKRLSQVFSVVGLDRRASSHRCRLPSTECLYVVLTSEPSVRRGLEAVRELQATGSPP
jgi:hypothetical protein